jgi:signal transduction histidine kinase
MIRRGGRQVRSAIAILKDEDALARGDEVAVSVADTGAGIPRDYLPRIFEPFVQVPHASGGGAGLGLTISRRIVEAHGGQLCAVGTGARIDLRSPSDRPEKGSAHGSSSSTTKRTSGR